MKYGDASACAAVGRCAGSHAHIEVISLIASGDACGMSWLSGVVENCGNLKFIAAASFMPSGHVVWFGVPMTEHIL